MNLPSSTITDLVFLLVLFLGLGMVFSLMSEFYAAYPG